MGGSTSYLIQDDAEEMADMLNEAFYAGRQSVSA
jgi:hypothetical protein